PHAVCLTALPDASKYSGKWRWWDTRRNPSIGATRLWTKRCAAAKVDVWAVEQKVKRRLNVWLRSRGSKSGRRPNAALGVKPAAQQCVYEGAGLREGHRVRWRLGPFNSVARI